VTTQILSLSHPKPIPREPNYFASLVNDLDPQDMMDIDKSPESNLPSQPSSSQYVTKTVSWSMDVGISTILDEIFTHLKKQ
jgi:hypothetical protein